MAEGIRIGGSGKKSGAYVWKKLTAEGGDFVDFTVSDSPTAYPDGGEQGGYWYEKAGEGIDLLSLGNYTKLAVDKFTLSATPTARFYTNHSLGARPKAFIIFGKATEIKGFEFYAGSFDGIHLYVLATASGNGKTNVSATSTDICLSSSPSVYFEAGIEYTLITMA